MVSSRRRHARLSPGAWRAVQSSSPCSASSPTGLSPSLLPNAVWSFRPPACPRPPRAIPATHRSLGFPPRSQLRCRSPLLSMTPDSPSSSLNLRQENEVVRDVSGFDIVHRQASCPGHSPGSVTPATLPSRLDTPRGQGQACQHPSSGTGPGMERDCGSTGGKFAKAEFTKSALAGPAPCPHRPCPMYVGLRALTLSPSLPLTLSPLLNRRITREH